jgi:hypothetical protein
MATRANPSGVLENTNTEPGSASIDERGTVKGLSGSNEPKMLSVSRDSESMTTKTNMAGQEARRAPESKN